MVSLSNHEAPHRGARPSWFDKLTMKAVGTPHFQSKPQLRFSSCPMNVLSFGAHLAASRPEAEWPNSLSISKYSAETPAAFILAMTSGAIDGGNTLSVRDRT